MREREPVHGESILRAISVVRPTCMCVVVISKYMQHYLKAKRGPPARSRALRRYN